MGWRDAWQLSDVAFRELSLQAIYAFRQGSPIPPGESRELVPRARRRVAQSKALVGFVIGLLTFGAAELLRGSPSGQTAFLPHAIAPGAFQAGILTGLFGLDVTLLWWTGLQSLPTYLSSGILPVLESLPIDRTTLRRVASIVYLRLFDAPAGVILVATPVLVGFALGPWAGLATVPGAFSTISFSLGLSLVTGRFFVRRVQGSRGGGGRTVVRWAYMLLWLVPAFGVLAFGTVATPFFLAIDRLAHGSVAAGPSILLVAYPFPLALLPAIAGGLASGVRLAPLEVAGLAVASAAYSLLAIAAGLWMLRSVDSIGRMPSMAVAAGPKGSYALHPQRPSWAMLTKDLRIASRTPGYAFLILLPLLDALALGLVSLVGASGSTAATGLAFGAVTAAALLATFFGPAFFAVEVLASSYARTLPLSQRPVVFGKVILIASIYLAASGTVLALAAIRVPSPLLFGLFIAAELPAVVGAAFLELGLLFRWSRSRGLPIPTLYGGAWTTLLVAIPGLFVAGLPLVLYGPFGLGGMALAALLGLGASAPFALWGERP